MELKATFKPLFFLAAGVMLSTALQAQVFWTENFGNSGVSCAGQGTSANGFVSSNGTWTMTNTGTNNARANTWFISSTEAGMGAGNCGDGCLNTASLTNRTLHVGNISTSTFAWFFCPTGDCGAAYDASTAAEITDKRAESPTINCTGKSTITLSFIYMENGQNTLDDGTVYYFDGSTWNLLVNTPKSNNTGCSGQGRWTAYSIALPASANNNPNVKIGFRWVNNGDGTGSDPSFGIDDITLSTPAAAPQANFTASNTNLCVGQCINFTDLSTNAPTTWSWTFQGGTPGTSTSQNPTNVCYNTAGTYSVTLTATNTNGSSTTSKTTYIIVSAAANLNASATNTGCGVNTGTASVTASAGNSPYTYSWNNGQTSSAATGLSAGTYTVTVTTANGCTRTTTASVGTNGGPTATLSNNSSALCNGGSSGSATVTSSGGTQPYTYSWNNGQTTGTATGLSAGNYTVVVTDAGGCQATRTVSISQPAALTASTSSTPTNCGASTGTAGVTASGGTGAFTYSWAPSGGNGANATGLSAGTYTITVTDNNGCTQTANATVNTNGGPSVSLTSSANPLCNGGTGGTATMSSTGGTTPYTYSWNNGQTTATATGLSAGNYTLTVTDAGGCISIQTVSITQPAAVSINASAANTNCNASDGSVSSTASGGTGSYTYSWSNGGTSQSITGLSAGTYTLVVTDANGCTGTATGTVGQNGGPTANAGTGAVITLGSSTVLSGSGGGTYTWLPPTGLSCTNCQNPVASPTVTTTYTLIVTDINGCSDSDTVTVVVDIPCNTGDIFVPNVFSPNGDSKNDVLMVYGNCFDFYLFQVYDRWGEKVFESSDPLKGWDGSYNGKLFGTAVFVYKLNAIMKDGKPIDKKGNVTLMR